MSTAAPSVGARFGKPSEMLSVNPLTISSMPSVTMKEGIPNVIVIAPLTSPTTPAPASASTTPIGIGSPASIAKYSRNGVMK